MAQITHTKKTRLACDSCRRQRRKCDRKTPACSSCEKRNDVCVYDPTFDQRSPEQKDYVAALEARVNLLEGVLRDAGARDIAGSLGVASTDEGDSAQAKCVIVPPPTVSTQPEPTAPGFKTGFVPSDDAAQALVSIVRPNPGEVAATTPRELDLGMGGYMPLVSLDMEHRLLAQFWNWQKTHLPYVAPVPFLSAYALYAAHVVHPDEPTSPPSPPPPNPLACSSATDIPSVESIHATPELAQFISPLLLDVVFVIGALFHGDTRLSNRFYKRAESRFMVEAANPRLATVQGVMLMATTEFGHAHAPSAWTLNGVTVALCVRLRMHIDATPLVRDGSMSKMLFETRNFVFRTICHNDRFYALCLGMDTLLDRRTISTPRYSSLAAANVVKPVKPVYPEPDASVAGPSSSPAEKSATPGVSTIRQSPTGDVFVQAGWEAMRDLAGIMDTLFDGIYAFDAPKRTPQEDLELVARNNLTIQRFLDGLPTYIRSIDTIRTKSAAFIHLHLAIHISTIFACRPFLSPRPLSEDAMRLDAATNISQPTHSSHIIRRYRTLAFRIARASALQIISLVRYIPLSSPFVTTPFVVHTACTILFLAPSDTAAMSGVRMGVACLKNMQDTGHWATSMKDGREGVLELATRWGVDIERGKKLLGLAPRGYRGGGGGGKEPGVDEANGNGATSGSNTRPAGAQSSDIGGAQKFPGNPNGTRPKSASGYGTESASVTRPSANTATLDETAEPGATRGYRHSDLTQYYEDYHPTRMYADPGYSEGVVPASNYGYTSPLPQRNYGAAISNVHCAGVARNYGVHEHTGRLYSHASGLADAYESANSPTYTQQQYHFPAPFRFDTQSPGVQYHDSSRTNSGVMVYERQVRLSSVTRQHIYPPQLQRQQQQHHQPSSKLRQPSQYRPFFQYPLRNPQAHSSTHYYHEPTSRASLPDVTYALSRAEPQYLPWTHRHQMLPPTDPNLAFPSDPVARTNLAVHFTDTVQAAQEPAFLRSTEEPHAGAAKGWPAGVGYRFPAAIVDTSAGLGVGRSSVGMGAAAGTLSNGGVSGMYAQGAECESYRREHPTVDYAREGSMGGYMT